MKKPPKNNVASVLARLRNVARDQSTSFNAVLQTYCNERLLARVAESKEADGVLLKGAQMLRIWGIPDSRPTMDIDFLKRGKADQDSLVELVKHWTAVKMPDDGVVFDAESITAESIRENGDYVGTRIRLNAELDNVREKVQIDFGVGDAVHPNPVTIEYPVLLADKPISLRAYPVEASIAEKVQAMVHLDMRNSRMKDFYDIWVLSRTLEFRGATLCRALIETFKRRDTEIPAKLPTALTRQFFEDESHTKQWTAFRRLVASEAVPKQLAGVIKVIAGFMEEPLSAASTGKFIDKKWSPPDGPWT